MPLISTAERVGREAGLAEGLEKGLEKGRQATREGLLKGIEVALDLKFSASGLALLPEIQQLEDTELLRKILDALKSSPNPDALRQLWRQP